MFLKPVVAMNGKRRRVHVHVCSSSLPKFSLTGASRKLVWKRKNGEREAGEIRKKIMRRSTSLTDNRIAELPNYRSTDLSEFSMK